jgi:uncharacterized protein YqcC (DUF446 family)
VETAYGEIADELEAELRRLGWWGSPAPEGPVTSAFGGRDMSFAQWLEHILVPRLREVAAGDAEPPGDSQVAAYAVRELDGFDEAGPLLEVLGRLDRLVAG